MAELRKYERQTEVERRTIQKSTSTLLTNDEEMSCPPLLRGLGSLSVREGKGSARGSSLDNSCSAA